MPEQDIQANEINRLYQTIGGLSASQDATRRDIEGLRNEMREGFKHIERSFDERINEVRKSYHDLNNKAMATIGRMEADISTRISTAVSSLEAQIKAIGTRVDTLDNRTKTIETTQHMAQVVKRTNKAWAHAITAVVASGLTLLGEFLVAHAH